MRRRRFYFIALLLVMLALVFHFVGITKVSEPSRAEAKSLSLPKDKGEELKLAAADGAKLGKIFLFIGASLAILAAASCWLSATKSEPISRIIPLSLLGFYILSQFLLI